ncbi:putative Diguanylate cyclase [Candidatus Competibacter denitrificans Run_A_D11]|uniref:cyclic-guanylate-specific phosphodiesterase n=1 Tax=Candidatus Competibacter denitrificans Run_A_D11 TaxID=1400863 RepID=W6M1T9_9GAMM|nr:EAL domain-containing protein [Candidatus Competibacter denitrificans]CDI01402.1 putative Diguanylate cyclase [Candidatus Competibacter denitrificans Run_A_D11]HRC70342.1 EAL domain-containing protein [Candidatus Competibacter denitrificans]
MLACLALLAGSAWLNSAQPKDPSSDNRSTIPPGQPTKITVVDDRSYPPFAFLDAEGRPRGITIDLWTLWSKKTGIAVEFYLAEWETALAAVREGRADVVGALFRTPQREEQFDFTNPYHNIATSLFFHQEIQGVRSIEDLAGFVVGVVKDDSAEELLIKQYANVKRQTYPGAEELVKAALAGDIKAFIADSQVVRFYLAKLEAGSEFREALTPVAVNALYAGVKKGNTRLMGLLEQGFQQVSAQEKIAIIENWTGISAFSKVPWVALRTLFTLIAAILCVMVLWNVQLKRKIAQATSVLQKRHEELQNSERNYREIFNATHEMIFLHDAREGRILDMNEAAVKSTGYSKQELLGQSIAKITVNPPATVDESPSYRIRKAVTDGTLVFQWLFQRRDGETFWAEVALKSSRIGGENRVLAVVRDISMHKQAEAALKNSEATLQSLFSAVPVGLAIVQNRRLQAVNERVCQISGYGRDVLLGRNMRSFYENDTEYQRVGEMLYQRLPPYGLKFVETRLRHANGSFRDISVCAALLNPQDPTGRVALTIQDITSQKKAQSALRASERRLRNIAKNIPGVVYQFYVRPNGQTGFYYISHRAGQLFGIGRRLNGAFNRFIKHVAPEHRKALLASIEQSVTTQSPWSFEWRFIKPTGESLWFRGASSPTNFGEELIYSGVVLDVTEHKLVEQRIAHLAYYDVLTALPNRALLTQRVELALALAARHQRQLALLFLDLDRFKDVNDSLGHSEGDLLLTQVAARLQALIRAEDTACRLGGDEFALLLPDTDQNGALRVADKLLEAFQQPYNVAGHRLRTTVSIGIALYPHDGANATELLKNADTALHRAKREGRNVRVFYDRQMNAATFQRLVLEGELRQAIAMGELRAYYQPQVRLTDQTLVGAEALIRWQHPQRGLVSPAEFIPIAEASDLVVALGRWMLEAVCQQLYHWHHSGLVPPPVAVNMAARHFHSPHLPSELHQLLETYGLPRHALELELTESTLLGTEETPEAALRAIEQLGIKLAVDDFGTGYSNLAYLKRLPLAALKIDRSFVRGLADDANDRILAATIIALGHQMGLIVVAEGVETEQQRQILLAQGCDLAQGFYFDRPMPAEAFADRWLQQTVGDQNLLRQRCSPKHSPTVSYSGQPE